MMLPQPGELVLEEWLGEWLPATVTRAPYQLIGDVFRVVLLRVIGHHPRNRGEHATYLSGVRPAKSVQCVLKFEEAAL